LSLLRAEFVKTRLEGMSPTLAKRMIANGVGSRQTMVGNGRDDAQRCARSPGGVQGYRLLKIDFPAKKLRPNFPSGIDSNLCYQLATPSSWVAQARSSSWNDPVHSMSNLFAQLGEANDPAAIARFIETHKPLPEDVKLHEAAFWSPFASNFSL
jgi:hypothetical protein